MSTQNKTLELCSKLQLLDVLVSQPNYNKFLKCETNVANLGKLKSSKKQRQTNKTGEFFCFIETIEIKPIKNSKPTTIPQVSASQQSLTCLDENPTYLN